MSLVFRENFVFRKTKLTEKHFFTTKNFWFIRLLEFFFLSGTRGWFPGKGDSVVIAAVERKIVKTLEFYSMILLKELAY